MVKKTHAVCFLGAKSVKKPTQEVSGQVPEGKVCVEEGKWSKKPTRCVFESKKA